MLKEISGRASSQLDIKINVTGAAKNYIIDESYDKKYGARPLRRKLQSMIEDELASQILLGNIKRGDTVKIGMENKKLKFEVVQ